MANPKIPPEIAKKIAAMKPAAPAAAPRAPVPQPAAPPRAPARAAPPGGTPSAPLLSVAAKMAIVGWVLAAGAGGFAYLQQQSFEDRKAAALAEQAAGYESRLQSVQAESAAALKKVQDDAAAQLTVLQTELDFQKLPELPLETTFRPGQVLYVESRADELFTCKVRLFRPSNSTSREVDFTLKARTYQDLAALDNWLFARGDRIEFVKPGYKPRSLTVP